MTDEIVELKINEHTKVLEQHEGRMSVLEKSDVKQESNIENLCDKIDKLIAQNNKWFYAVICGMGGLLVKVLFFK
jgi:hypothetical protein